MLAIFAYFLSNFPPAIKLSAVFRVFLRYSAATSTPPFSHTMLKVATDPNNIINSIQLNEVCALWVIIRIHDKCLRKELSESRAENKRQWLADTLQIIEIYGYLLSISSFTLKMTIDNIQDEIETKVFCPCEIYTFY